MPETLVVVERLKSSIRQWPSAKVQASGLEIFALDAADCAQRRRSQARTVLGAEHVLSLLEPSDGPFVLMKGLEVAQLYPDVLDRPFRDVDLLVQDAPTVWQRFAAAGYTARPTRRYDIDHHHLPALVAPFGRIGLEVHHRANTPAWAPIDTATILETAQPSRTSIPGVLRPRDDLHALIMALHCWKGGFTRTRDLFDALLLAGASDVPVERTAAEWGLARVWRWTVRFAELQLFNTGSRRTRLLAGLLLPRRHGIADRRRVRLLAPYLVANPIRVTKGHIAEYRLSREARRKRASQVPEHVLST